MSHADSQHMAEDNRNYGGVPDEPGIDDADIDPIIRRAKKVPAASMRAAP